MRQEKIVLVVDDDKDILTVLSLILQEENYSVRKALTGKEALRSIEENIPDLILLDYMLPDINGDEVAARVRKKYSIPIVLISAAHDGEKIAAKAKLDGFIAKPFEIEVLLKKVSDLLST